MGDDRNLSSGDSVLGEIGEQPSLLLSEEVLNALAGLDQSMQENIVRMAMSRQREHAEARMFQLRTDRILGLEPHHVKQKRIELQATRVRWSVALSIASLFAYFYAAAEQVALGLGGQLLVIMPSASLGVNLAMTFVRRKR